ncbi:MAG: aminotransferase class V-fold PLP-dependent enzyme [Bacillota bacterium]|nr:aminotransferase class V-fold PLP-dependent enzyme [Bacillota bacterium]
MDSGATSFPKAPGVAERVFDYLTNQGTNVGRSGFDFMYDADRVVYETRERVAKLFSFRRPEHVVFTKNVTESLNIVIKGLFVPGDHVLVSSVEHNAVMRPLFCLEQSGVVYERVPSLTDGSGAIDVKAIESRIRPETKALICTHASNVSGTVNDVEAIGSVCRKHGIYFVIDAAQTAGSIEVNFERFQADAIGFTGHKGLLAPQGIGGLLLSEELTKTVRPLVEGGTGSLSEEIRHPSFMPDKFEAGTPNIPAIYGLHESLGWIEHIGISEIRRKERDLTGEFMDRVREISGVRIIGRQNLDGRTSVVSLDVEGVDLGTLAHCLARDHGIQTRSGMHCAPCAHRTLGTSGRGTIRFGFGYFLELEDIVYAVDRLYRQIDAMRSGR